MWRSIASIFYTIVRGVGVISGRASSCLNVLVAGMIFIAVTYRFLVRIIVEIMVDRRRIEAGTGEAGQS